VNAVSRCGSVGRGMAETECEEEASSNMNMKCETVKSAMGESAGETRSHSNLITPFLDEKKRF